MTKLKAAEVKAALLKIPGWQRRGAKLVRTIELDDFPRAIRFVTAVAKLAERANHHPDFEIRYRQVTLTLTTHDAGGLTTKDFDLAAKVNQLAT